MLLLFRSLLGGSICRQSASTGSKKATVAWQVWGSKMAAAAERLKRVPSMKQAELYIARQGNVAATDRAEVARELQRLKQRNYLPLQLPQCSWPYFAGFFDAEGSVRVVSHSASCRLQIQQVNPCVLAQLQRFLHANSLQSWRLRNYKRCSELDCANLDDCKQTLKLLRANGLRVKARQAQLALSLTTENHLETREAISSLAGLQMRYHFLDHEGAARAKKIQRLQVRLSCLRKASGEEHESLQRELDHLQKTHKLQNLVSECQLRRKDIRRALREGGSYILDAQCEKDRTDDECHCTLGKEVLKAPTNTF